MPPFTRTRRAAILLCPFVTSISARAQSTPSTPAQQLPTVSVSSSPWGLDENLSQIDTDLEVVRLSDQRSLSATLENLPNVEFSKRGANNTEPVIRGFSFDRISTLFNGLPLINASPTRTSAPVNFFQSGLIGQLRVERSFPSVSDGPITTGGRLSIDSFPPPSRSLSAPTQPPLHSLVDGSLQLRSFGNQQGFTAGTALTGQTDRVSYRLAGQYVKLGDYTSGDGRTVDADHEGWGESAAIRTHLSEHQSVEVALHHYHQALDRNISLPFDTVDTDFYAATLNYTWSAENHHLYWRSGYTETHPRLSTTARPDDDDDDPTPTPAPPAGGGGPGGPGGPGGGGSGNPPPARPVDTDLRGDTIAYSGGLSWQTTWSSELISLLGVDATWSRRNASRERLLSDNSVNIDHLWPDVRTRDLGLFGELTWNREANHVRFGARIDRVDREARAADGLIIGIPGARGATIRQNYIAFNGPAAGETTRNHTVGAVNFTYEHDLSTKLTARLGLGLTRMAPTESESYRSFLSNPLGVGDLGNPALDPETKREIEAGLQYSSDQLQFTGQIFYAAIDDYIQRTLILTTPSTIFSFRNSDAAYYGAEAALVVTPTATPGLSFNASASTVQGYDRNTRIDQAGLPPWCCRSLPSCD